MFWERSADSPVSRPYQGDREKAIEMLQNGLNAALMGALRYTMHAVAAGSVASQVAKSAFATRAREEREHVQLLAARIKQLGGKPDFDPKGLEGRAAAMFDRAGSFIGMIRENLAAELIAMDHYRKLIPFFGDRDPGTRKMLENILRVSEEHVTDMRTLLVDLAGEPVSS